MKQFKLLVLAALTLVSVTARSQEKTEVQYTPKTGDYAISISGVPMSQYIGQFFNGALGNNLAEFGGQAYIGGDVNTIPFQKIMPLMSVSGKYFLDKETAIRVNLGLIYQRTFTKTYADDDADHAINPFSQKKVRLVQVEFGATYHNLVAMAHEIMDEILETEQTRLAVYQRDVVHGEAGLNLRVFVQVAEHHV